MPSLFLRNKLYIPGVSLLFTDKEKCAAYLHDLEVK